MMTLWKDSPNKVFSCTMEFQVEEGVEFAAAAQLIEDGLSYLKSEENPAHGLLSNIKIVQISEVPPEEEED